MSEVYEPETLSVREYQPDELPRISELSQDLRYLLEEYDRPKYRRAAALDYAGALRARYTPGEYSLETPEYAAEQVLPRLFLDSFLLTANRQDYQSRIKKSSDRRDPATFPALKALIGAKIDFQLDVMDYTRLNPDKTSMTLYGNLAALTLHGRRILYGDTVTDEDAKQKSLSQLVAALAEYKVLSALWEKWPSASIGSVIMDTKGTDIVIPTLHNPEVSAVLQVKSSRRRGYDFKVDERGHQEVPIVMVPMDTDLHDPFELSRQQRKTLRNIVANFPRGLLLPTAEVLGGSKPAVLAA